MFIYKCKVTPTQNDTNFWSIYSISLFKLQPEARRGGKVSSLFYVLFLFLASHKKSSKLFKMQTDTQHKQCLSITISSQPFGCNGNGNATREKKCFVSIADYISLFCISLSHFFSTYIFPGQQEALEAKGRM